MDDYSAPDNYDEKIRLLVRQLTMGCPMKEPRHDCPLAELRKLPLKEKLIMVDTMSAQKLKKLLQYHYDCFERINR